MNKDELLKIYSAYLPYELNVGLSDEGKYNLDSEYPNEHANKTGVITEFTISNGEFGYGEFKVSDKYYFSFNELSEIKPLLYDLSYLTKEIEHNCLIIKPIEYISTSIADRNKTLKMVENKDPLDVLPQWKFEKLLKFHFNVFNLPESEYINKATLTQKQ
ncbi:Uncharacterised protein [Chryseobacterium gleum]|uniref:Uncharacterized protein n=2 Tax=Chryseobacterium gleum TaxID=250 RepID=A0A3S4PHM8_CHRGE|nr:hypothetical protein [Chryseobacterium gleum]EFK36835.1 hypothetical protein HMPREF0204_11392 [Chryseobacterium gleum ATCC 35910]QQY32088.1 hypothetical protein I6I60_25205 [Chryseobacterium gleum]VEE10691.1 Uncharacterised protein [Chryseobacterium gleum]